MGDPDDRLSMNDVFKYELYNMDRRFANHIPNLFFKTRMKMAHKVKNSANARLRMGKLGDTKLTVGDIRSGEMRRVVLNLISATPCWNKSGRPHSI